ncbi:MAG: hypothetical protein GF341_09610 [candidate division Zixibacteria bacterium]|nr:hypothetical protein [candidate division Zixibacteria bacterium]
MSNRSVKLALVAKTNLRPMGFPLRRIIPDGERGRDESAGTIPPPVRGRNFNLQDMVNSLFVNAFARWSVLQVRLVTGDTEDAKPMKKTTFIAILLLAFAAGPALALDFQQAPSYLWGGASSVVSDYDIVVAAYPVGLRVYKNSSADGFPVVGQFEFSNGVNDMVLHGADLYFTANDRSLHRVDLSQPDAPQYVGPVGAAPGYRLVESSGDWMVTAGSHWLRLFALSDTATPVLVDSTFFTEQEQLLALSDTVIILMTAALELRSFAIAGGELTGILSSDASSVSGSAPLSLGMYESRVYIARRNEGVMILDYSDPATPMMREPFFTYGSANDVAVAGNRLMIADETLGLVSCRLYDPDNPYWQDEDNTFGAIYRVWPGMNGRFFASQNTDIVAVDTDALGQIGLAGRFSHPGSYRRLVRSGEVAFISDVFGLWRAIPDSIVSDSSFQRAGLFGQMTDLSMNDGLLFTAEGPAGAGIYTPDEAGNLTRQSRVDVDRFASLVAFADNRLVVAQSGYGFEIFDVSNPTVPDEIGRYRRSRGFLDAIMPNERYLYLSESNGSITVYDFEQPIKPKKLGTFAGPVSVNDMLIYGGHLYVADNPGGLYVYSLTNPSAPTQVTMLPVNGGTQALWRSGRTLYAAGATGRVLAFDIDDPHNPVLIGETDLAYPITDIAKFGERLWYLSSHFVGTLDVLPPLLPGDTDNNGVLEPVDLVVLIDYVFRNGKPLIRPNTADVNGDGSANLVDVVRMVDALYMNGGPLVPGTLE